MEPELFGLSLEGNRAIGQVHGSHSFPKENVMFLRCWKQPQTKRHTSALLLDFSLENREL